MMKYTYTLLTILLILPFIAIDTASARIGIGTVKSENTIYSFANYYKKSRQQLSFSALQTARTRTNTHTTAYTNKNSGLTVYIPSEYEMTKETLLDNTNSSTDSDLWEFRSGESTISITREEALDECLSAKSGYESYKRGCLKDNLETLTKSMNLSKNAVRERFDPILLRKDNLTVADSDKDITGYTVEYTETKGKEIRYHFIILFEKPNSNAIYKVVGRDIPLQYKRIDGAEKMILADYTTDKPLKKLSSRTLNNIMNTTKKPLLQQRNRLVMPLGEGMVEYKSSTYPLFITLPTGYKKAVDTLKNDDDMATGMIGFEGTDKAHVIIEPLDKSCFGSSEKELRRCIDNTAEATYLDFSSVLDNPKLLSDIYNQGVKMRLTHMNVAQNDYGRSFLVDSKDTRYLILVFVNPLNNQVWKLVADAPIRSKNVLTENLKMSRMMGSVFLESK